MQLRGRSTIWPSWQRMMAVLGLAEMMASVSPVSTIIVASAYVRRTLGISCKGRSSFAGADLVSFIPLPLLGRPPDASGSASPAG
jgi:hypothetical protein